MSNWLTSSIGRKFVMGFTGLFLISFLIVHCSINAMIYMNDGGQTFATYAHFMGTNPIIHIMEFGLFAGLLLHIIQGLLLYFKNKAARPVSYVKTDGAANSSWYSRSMTLLGTLILIFLIVHLKDFWGPNRWNQVSTGEELNLFDKMKEEFSEIFTVILYVVGCISLAWHLIHGFSSAFQTFGLNHPKYSPIIKTIGIVFSVVIAAVFASMPISMYFNLVH